MEFPKTNNILKFIKDYYSKNIKKYVVYKKEKIYFPKECSSQMANLVLDYMREDLNMKVSLNRTYNKVKENRTYYILVDYK
jgi:hypothetical protein